ncbi:MAG: hypothetical protein MMC33_006689 [Icmadophila ericetorum]|nr:hypothetical protein [Icmadophila ericetorum]
MDSDLANVEAFYNGRASTYDDSFHPLQAADYMEYVDPQPGEAWLDLACGTGLVTHLGAAAVGPTGHIIGVDIAEAMLQHAREKGAAMGGSHAKFVRHDVTNLEGLEAVGVVRGRFDIITCCSALPLPKNIDRTLQHWAEYLKHGGRLVADVPSTNALLNTGMFVRIAPRCGLEGVMPDDRGWIKSLESLGEKFKQAGLVTERLSVSRAYGGRIYEKEKLEEWFERTAAVPIYADLDSHGWWMWREQNG